MTSTAPIAYIGPAGADLGFKLAGIDTYACTKTAELIELLKKLRDTGQYKIMFVDEGMAAGGLEEVERLNQQTIPAIILISNPNNPQHLAKEKMDRLIIKALGSDILNT